MSKRSGKVLLDFDFGAAPPNKWQKCSENLVDCSDSSIAITVITETTYHIEISADRCDPLNPIVIGDLGNLSMEAARSSGF